MRDVRLAKALGYEDLHRLPEQLGARVAEDPLRLPVDEDDHAVVRHDDHGVGGGLEQIAKLSAVHAGSSH